MQWGHKGGPDLSAGATMTNDHNHCSPTVRRADVPKQSHGPDPASLWTLWGDLFPGLFPPPEPHSPPPGTAPCLTGHVSSYNQISLRLPLKGTPGMLRAPRVIQGPLPSQDPKPSPLHKTPFAFPGSGPGNGRVTMQRTQRPKKRVLTCVATCAGDEGLDSRGEGHHLWRGGVKDGGSTVQSKVHPRGVPRPHCGLCPSAF